MSLIKFNVLSQSYLMELKFEDLSLYIFKNKSKYIKTISENYI